MTKNHVLKIIMFVGMAVALASGISACSNSSNNDPIVTLKGAAT